MVLGRIIASIPFCFLLLLPSPSRSGQPPLKFTLNYETVHGGLRIAVVPHGQRLPRLGLALAGGGAKAAAAIGVLKVLQEEGIPVAAIAGTSMGAAVGGLFAAGYRPDEIEKIFLANDWDDIFNDRPARAFQRQEQKETGSRHLLEFTFREGRFVPPYGLSAGQKLTNLLAASTLAASFEADFDFNRLAIPFRAIATDIETGEAAVLDRGLLHDAIRASIAIPLVFQPVEIRGRLLVDGGLANNLPVEVVRSMGPDAVIAVDASARLEKKERLLSLVDIMSQSISLQVRRESERQAVLADLVISPRTGDFSFTDFPSMGAIIRRGEEAARAALPRIRELMKPKGLPRRKTRTFRIRNLSVRGNEKVRDAVLRLAMAPVLSGREADAVDVRKTLSEVYRLGHFSEVSLSIRKEGAGHSALLIVRENPVVTSVSVSGNSVVPDDLILPKFDWQVGRPLNMTRMREELDRIVDGYRSRGYRLVCVRRTEVAPDGRLEIELDEARIDSISLSGKTRISRNLIRRETQTRAGQPLNLDVAAQDVQRLYALDYFESLAVDIRKSTQGGLDLTLKFKEKPTNKIRLGLRYDLEDYFTGLTDVIVDNVGGRGVKVFLNTRYGNYTDLAFGYRSPVVLRANFLHTVSAFYRDRNYFLYEDKHRVREFEVTRKGIEVAFGYQWFRFGDTYLRYRFVSDTTAEVLGPHPAEELDRIGSLAFLSTLDTRDSSTFPGRGTLFTFAYETADPGYGGIAKYSKAFLYGQGFVPFGERHTAVLEAAGGIGSGRIPYQEQYGLGGADYVLGVPLLGYQRREFTGDNILAFSAGYRFRIHDYQLSLIKAVYLNLAWNAGNVWDSKDDMALKDLRSGGGIGLYADTVIGPVRLDFAKGEEHRYTVYFSAGFDF